LLCIGILHAGGCVPDPAGDRPALTVYQQQLADTGPQPRVTMEGREPEEAVGLLQPVERAERVQPKLEIAVDPNTGKEAMELTLEQAITRALANSPEIQVVSFDPEIARQEITKALADFDPTAFGRLFYENQDNPANSFYEPGQAETRLFESGVRQRTPIGSEWSLSYALSRNWDDLFGRTLSTRYEPMLVFQLKQPLLRDAWEQVNLAGVNTARLEHRIALQQFRDRAENLSAEVITVYWRMVQARGNLEIQRELVAQTLQTLQKVEGRREIDATDVQLMQAKAYAKVREANQLDFEKQVLDVQDLLVRLLADPQINTTTEVTVVPVTPPETAEQPPDLALMLQNSLAVALANHPAVQQAQIGIEIAEINVQAARNQKMPRLDLVASATAQGLAGNRFDAHEQLEDTDYTTYSVGVTLEYPLGNRQREAEHIRRRLERRRAVSVLHNTADQVAVGVKEKARKARTRFAEIAIQHEAVEAAGTQLKALEESEPIREQLTPEFLLVKLQAQETHTQARRAELNALIEFNISRAELARATGTVLGLRRVEEALTEVTRRPEPVEEDRGPDTLNTVPRMQPSGLLYSVPAKVK